MHEVRGEAVRGSGAVPFIGLPGERDAVDFIPVIVRAGAEETGGAFEVYEIAAPAGAVRDVVGEGPPAHVHRDHAEVFYVLEGQATFDLGGDHRPAPRGSLVIVPRGVRHRFDLDLGSRILVFAVPGGLAGFFRELGAGLATGRADAEMRASLAGRYDSYPESP